MNFASYFLPHRLHLAPRGVRVKHQPFSLEAVKSDLFASAEVGKRASLYMMSNGIFLCVD